MRDDTIWHRFYAQDDAVAAVVVTALRNLPEESHYEIEIDHDAEARRTRSADAREHAQREAERNARRAEYLSLVRERERAPQRLALLAAISLAAVLVWGLLIRGGV